MDSYAPKAWYVMQDSEIGEPKTEALILSVNERRRFIQAAVGFENYCRMFFLREKALFKRNESKETNQYGRCFLTTYMMFLWRRGFLFHHILRV